MASVDFLTTFLASILHEQGIQNAPEVAAKAAADLRRGHLVDENTIKRAAIRADPRTDYKAVARENHVSIACVYRVWSKR